jgi:hypothetical protein
VGQEQAEPKDPGKPFSIYSCGGKLSFSLMLPGNRLKTRLRKDRVFGAAVPEFIDCCMHAQMTCIILISRA